ncbi:MAG: SMC family ATPase [Nanoarchaeota archaeon]|nr:SMC family ATPase [Nanoarchaeota archaeon]
MIIKYVKLENIRSYLNQTIDFPHGSVLLSGDIGSGKSTILLSIEFALFGIMKSLSGSSLLRNGKTKGSVDLNFTLDDKNIIIKRTLKRQGGDVRQDSGFIIINGKKTEGTAVELKSKILDLLGYPRELVTKTKSLIYRYTVYTPQEEMKQILLDDKDYRLDTLRRVFQIDKYKRIRENTQIIIREIREKTKEFNGMIIDLEEKKKQKKEKDTELKNVMIKIEDVKPKIEAAESIVKGKKESRNQLEKEIDELNDLRKKEEIANTRLKEKVMLVQNYKENIEILNKSIKELNTKIEEFKIEPIKENESEVEKLIIKKEEEYNYLMQRKIELTEKNNSLQKRKKELREEISIKSEESKKLIAKKNMFDQLQHDIHKKEYLKKEISEKEEDIKKINLTIKENEVNKEKSEKIKKDILKSDKCPICSQRLSSEHKKYVNDVEDKKIKIFIENLSQENKRKKIVSDVLINLNAELESLLQKEKTADVLKIEISRFGQLGKEIVEKQKLLNKLSLEDDKIKEELDSINKKNLDEIKRNISESKDLLKKIRKSNTMLNKRQNLINLMDEKNKNMEDILKNIASLKKEIGEINNLKIELDDKIKRFEGIEQNYKILKQELEKAISNETLLAIKKAQLDKEAEGINKAIKGLEKEINEKLRIKKKINYLKQMRNWLDNYFIKLMSIMERQIMSRVYHEFNELFKDWFNILMEEENISVRLDDEFTPIIEQNDYETSIEYLSGGERTSLALAYRLALNKVINNIIGGIKTKDLIILDEPTDGFSTDQLDKVKAVFDQLNIKQSIIVSHENKIESFVSNIMRINKDEHVSSVVSI